MGPPTERGGVLHNVVAVDLLDGLVPRALFLVPTPVGGDVFLDVAAVDSPRMGFVVAPPCAAPHLGLGPAAPFSAVDLLDGLVLRALSLSPTPVGGDVFLDVSAVESQRKGSGFVVAPPLLRVPSRPWSCRLLRRRRPS